MKMKRSMGRRKGEPSEPRGALLLLLPEEEGARHHRLRQPSRERKGKESVPFSPFSNKEASRRR